MHYDRFEMAKALVGQAMKRADEIGDDHGDPYEQMLVTGTVPIEIQITLKEVLEHLRSALDYVARETVHTLCPSRSEKVYFPIAAKNAREADFKLLFGRSLPGVIELRSELVQTFASFQCFSKDENYWLPCLATLTNENKHENLSVTRCTGVKYTLTKADDGSVISNVQRADGSYFRQPQPLMLLKPTEVEGTYTCIYVELAPTGEELLSFIRNTTAGVKNVITTVKDAL